MDSKPGKLKRRKVRKIKVKEPGAFTLKMGSIFGAAYIENSRQINIGIFLFVILVVGFVLLLTLGSPILNFTLPPISD